MCVLQSFFFSFRLFLRVVATANRLPPSISLLALLFLYTSSFSFSTTGTNLPVATSASFDWCVYCSSSVHLHVYVHFWSLLFFKSNNWEANEEIVPILIFFHTQFWSGGNILILLVEITQWHPLLLVFGSSLQNIFTWNPESNDRTLQVNIMATSF